MKNMTGANDKNINYENMQKLSDEIQSLWNEYIEKIVGDPEFIDRIINILEKYQTSLDDNNNNINNNIYDNFLKLSNNAIFNQQPVNNPFFNGFNPFASGASNDESNNVTELQQRIKDLERAIFELKSETQD